MKIIPVTGSTPIANGASTGLAPEKLARLKAIAAGGTPPEPTVDDGHKRAAIAAMTTPRITMQTNRTVHREISAGGQQEGTEPAPDVISAPVTTPETTQTAISGDSGSNDASANVEPEATEPLSPQFAALARQRRALQLKEQEIAQKVRALEGPTRAELETRIKTQPLSVLQELGVTYDQLTQEILSAQAGHSPDLQALKAEIRSIKEDVDKTLAQKDSNAEEAVLGQMANTIFSLAAEGDDFELIRATNSQEDVLRRIHETWKKTGEVLDERAAMKIVETELEQEALNIAKLKKVQGKLQPQQVAEAPLQRQAAQGMRTLTNKDSAKPMLDRKQRAMLAFQGNLKR
jgi:hypothetical protein